MNVLVVYSSTFGLTERLAREIARALGTAHAARVLPAHDALDLWPSGVDLLVVGAPTQMRAHWLGVHAFLASLGPRGFAGVPAAAFDTRLPGERSATGSAADRIARELTAAGCRLIGSESFGVAGFTGPLADGEVERARAWARDIAERAAVPL